MNTSRFWSMPVPRIAASTLAAVALQANAGTYTNDFSSDPLDPGLPAAQRLTIFSNQAVGNANRPSWVATGGNTGGYLKLTDAIGSIRSTIVFPDFEPGFPVAGFNFGVDCRIGGGAATPADGFSINFARKDASTYNDTVITTGTPYAGTNNVGHTEADRHEEGTRTGLGIGFDAYYSGGEDVIGISVRVDDQLLFTYAAPVLNGSATDATSLQTGPLITGTAAEKVAALGWGRFEVNLDPSNGKLDIFWKGVKVVDQLDTNFVPSAGRLVFGARTGGQNQVHHFDNVALETFPVEKAAVTLARIGHDGLVFEISDYGTNSVVTTSDITSITVNGNTVTPTSVTKANGITTVKYLPSPAFTPRQSVTYGITAQDQTNAVISATGTLNAPVLPLDFFIDENATTNLWNIREIRGGTIAANPAPIDSALAISAAPPTTPTDYSAPFFNISDDTNFGGRGFFKRDAIYATSVAAVDDNNIVALGSVRIEVAEAGEYTFWVQSDDGFALRVNGSPFTKVAGLGILDPSDSSTITFLNGTGNSNTRGTVTLSAGEHILDFLWFEGTSGSYSEVAWAKGDHAADTTTGKWSLVGGSGETQFFPVATFAEPALSGVNWAVRNYYGGAPVPTLRDAFTVIAAPGAYTILDAPSPVVNFRDPENPGADGIFRNNLPFPMETPVPGIDDNQFVTLARYEFTAATAGDYSFAITSDDGFAFRMLGGPYIINSAGPANNNSGIDPLDSTAFVNTNASGEPSYPVYRVSAPGTYVVEVVQVEQAGGASLEVAWAPGNFTTLNATSSWKLLGNPDDPAVPAAAPIIPDNLVADLAPAPAGAWSTRFYYPNAGIGNLNGAITETQVPGAQFLAANYEYLNFRNFVASGEVEGTWVSGLFTATSATPAYQTPAELQYLGATGLDDDIIVLAKARIVIPATGDYTFGISSDDGFALRILGAPNGFQRVSGTATIDSAQTNTVYRLTGSNSARAVINLPVGEYDVEYAYYEGVGNAHFELYTAAGNFTNDADTANWRLIGATASGGLSIAAQPVPPTEPTPTVIGTFAFNAQSGDFSFSFNSSTNASYRIEYSNDLIDWFVLDSGYPGDSGESSTTFTGNVSDLIAITDTTKVFFRTKDVTP